MFGDFGWLHVHNHGIKSTVAVVGGCNSLAVVVERQQGGRDWRVSKPPTSSMGAAQPLVR